MFQGFSQEALDFLTGIRANNEKEWFEAHKPVYTEFVMQPLKDLSEILLKPYADKSMICKTARIYKDASFPPYQHYRDTMWIYVRHEAVWWNQTPTLFFELSPEGAAFGFRIAKPRPAVMERFRRQLTDSSFPEIISRLEEKEIFLSGEEYKRCKPGSTPETERFFKLKSCEAKVNVPASPLLFSPRLADSITEVFKEVWELYDFWYSLTSGEPSFDRSAGRDDLMAPPPKEDFMW